jgi:hypothetical protein
VHPADVVAEPVQDRVALGGALVRDVHEDPATRRADGAPTPASRSITQGVRRTVPACPVQPNAQWPKMMVRTCTQNGDTR